jgi:hypothetical protein
MSAHNSNLHVDEERLARAEASARSRTVAWFMLLGRLMKIAQTARACAVVDACEPVQIDVRALYRTMATDLEEAASFEEGAELSPAEWAEIVRDGWRLGSPEGAIALAAHLPLELQDARIKDLEAEIKSLNDARIKDLEAEIKSLNDRLRWYTR